jgi:small subunit ribosomal protein S1
VLLEEERELERARLRERLKAGARLEGTVTAVRDFGAFVDLGGLEGLVPNSELGHGRVRAADVLAVGQRVEVEVREVAPPGPKDKTERVTLSMRALAQDPWEVVLPELEVGDVLRGKVVRLQPFGTFVELVPGLDGLVHVSSLGRGAGRRIQHPADVVSVGDAIAVRVDSIDVGGRRLGLAFVPADEVAALTATSTVTEAAPVPTVPTVVAAPGAALPGLRVRKTDGAPESVASTGATATAAPRVSPVQKLGKQAVPAEQAAEAAPVAAAFAPPSVGQVVDAVVDKIESFGLFVSWNGGSSRGLLPMSELPVPKGTDLRRAYPVGTALRAAVVEVRPEGKVRLSVTAVAHAEERAEASLWMRSQQSRPGAGGKGFGTFADLLRSARS